MKKETDRSVIKKLQIKEAAKALKEFHTKWEKENPPEKKSLLDDSSQAPVLLTFTLKKIPKLSNIQMIKVPLPHTLVTDVSEVCLITRDLDKKDKKADIEPTVRHYKQLLSKCGVNNVTEIIPLRQLRTEYKQYEAKRKLCGAYDFFLGDNKITQCLPRVLGKVFFDKRKLPQQINLDTSNLKRQIENALSRTVFNLSGRGNACTAEVAHLGLTTRQMVENIDAAINTLAVNIPGTWKNINSLYIKTPRSVSIPVYMSLESGNDVELPAPESDEDVEAEEITALKGCKVKVFRDGNIKVISTDESNSSEDEDNSDVIDTLPKKKKKQKRKVNIDEAEPVLLEKKIKTEPVLLEKKRKNHENEEGINRFGSEFKKREEAQHVDKTIAVLRGKKIRNRQDEEDVNKVGNLLSKKKKPVKTVGNEMRRTKEKVAVNAGKAVAVLKRTKTKNNKIEDAIVQVETALKKLKANEEIKSGKAENAPRRKKRLNEDKVNVDKIKTVFKKEKKFKLV